MEAGLAASAPLEGYVFGVTVAGGVVTLSGEMETREDADEAVSVASRAPGVVSVTDALEVVAFEPVPRDDTDAQILATVRRNLGAAAELRYESIDAVVENRIVTLSGRVTSAPGAALAVRIAESVAGVGGVRSFIDVPDAGGDVAVANQRSSLAGAASESQLPTFDPPEGAPAGLIDDRHHGVVRRAVRHRPPTLATFRIYCARWAGSKESVIPVRGSSSSRVRRRCRTESSTPRSRSSRRP